MFIRKKRNSRGGSDYHPLVQNCRVEGQPRQKVVMHPGGNPTVDKALNSCPKDISDLRRRGYPQAAEELRTKLDRLKELRDDGTV
jgi:hypothetical protein